MKPAEYALRRIASGLSITWIAEHSGVNTDTAAQWEAIGGEPDSQAVKMVEVATEWQQKQIQAARKAKTGHTLLLFLDQFDYYSVHGSRLPFDTYNQLMAHIYMEQQASGLKPVVHFFDPDAYAHWLGDSEDTSEQRGRWVETLNQ